MEGGQINFKAYSDLSRKILKCTFEDKDLKPEDRGVFEDCEGVYDMIDDCLAEKRGIRLSDVGVLTFPYVFNTSKRKQVDKIFEIQLKEVEIGESERMAMRIDQLESTLKKFMDKMQEINKQQSTLNKVTILFAWELLLILSGTVETVPTMQMHSTLFLMVMQLT